MTLHYTARGLTSLELILLSLPRLGLIAYPDFLCDEVQDLIEQFFPPYLRLPYRVTRSLSVDWGTVGGPPDIFYGVDYFGREMPKAMAGVTIRDAVWMPLPVRPLSDNEYWFNSFRKFAWPFRGSELRASRPVQMLLWDDVGNDDVVAATRASRAEERAVRLMNYDRLQASLPRLGVPGFRPDFPSVYPIVVSNRDEVRAACLQEGFELPGTWANRRGSENPLYRELLLIPCDGRFTPEAIYHRARIVRSVARPVN